ncbi:MAG: hypothetical protein V2J55_06775 [Candidatus Competibacteraceae bacterium]|jgi:hypothetical protein|nr:hypothetical protein [Candidatus Competibacteraceae bacterium]
MCALSSADAKNLLANSVHSRDDGEELNLKGLGYEQAQQVLQQVIQQNQGSKREFLTICIDDKPLPGTPDNLLLPISWQLTEARDKGLITRCLLLPATNVIKFFVEFPVADVGENAEQAS